MCLIALAMFSTAILRKPSAISSGVRACRCRRRRRRRARRTSRAPRRHRAARRRAGPNTCGNRSGSSLPTITLQSVTVERTAAAIRGGPRIGARRLGPDAKARAVERADRAAARRDRVDAHHRRAQAHARHLRHERALVLARPVRDVGGRAAHVEADDAVEAGQPRHLHRADDAAGGSGQDRVLALEQMRVGEPAARLHELQAQARCGAAAGRARARPARRSGAGSATGRRRPPSCRRATRASSAGSPRATPTPA